MANYIFDFDGVIVRSRATDGSMLWSQQVTRDLGISNELLDLLFSFPEWHHALEGQFNAKERFSRILEHSGSQVTGEQFIEYWLSHDLQWMEPMLDFISKLANEGHHLMIATNQDQIRRDYIKNRPEIRERFHQVIASADLGVVKPDIEYFKKVDQIVAGQKPIIFIDDRLENIECALSIGWNAIHFDPDLSGHRLDDLMTRISEIPFGATLQP